MNDVKTFKLDSSAQKLVNRKVKEMNDFLATVDIKKFFEEEAKRKKAAKS
ncbi:MAG TPA: hypothetical protein VN038_25945 [Dyadobacter sp.]|jgi:hypothetical protein|nr:hypothetical protein [Dyadobacter sp.]